ncbi:MAG TPA: 50S ribosomal protein L17 [Clostridiales bacterium]|nr:50S ribosomal protein L17 [Clostridiales bacterium]
MGQAKLGRTRGHRRALFRNLVTALFAHERIETTEAKARECRPIAEQLITLAKRGDLHARRQAAAFILDEDVLKRLFDEIGPRYADRSGGYTRIVKLDNRRGDGAPIALLELVR